MPKSANTIIENEPDASPSVTTAEPWRADGLNFTGSRTSSGLQVQFRSGARTTPPHPQGITADEMQTWLVKSRCFHVLSHRVDQCNKLDGKLAALELKDDPESIAARAHVREACEIARSQLKESRAECQRALASHFKKVCGDTVISLLHERDELAGELAVLGSELLDQIFAKSQQIMRLQTYKNLSQDSLIDCEIAKLRRIETAKGM